MALQKHLITITWVLLSLLLVYGHHHHALAASGGRMGRTSFSSSSRTRAYRSRSTLGNSYITRTSCSKLSSSTGYSTQVTSPVHPRIKYLLGPYDVCFTSFIIIICAIYLLLKQCVDGDAAETNVLKLQKLLPNDLILNLITISLRSTSIHPFQHPVTANTQFLLQSNSLFQHSFRSFPTKWHVGVSGCQRFTNAAFSMNHSPYKIITASRKMRMKCFIMNDDGKGDGGEEDKDMTKVAIDSNINEVIWRSRENVLKASVLLGLLFVYDNGRLALAVSGGRMCGSSFSSSRGSSSRSSSSTSSSSGSYSRPSSSSSTSYSRPSSSSSSESYHTQIGTSSPVRYDSANESRPINWFVVVTVCAVVCAGYFLLEHYESEKRVVKKSVLMLQVGLLGTAKSLQADLNRIAEVADTSTAKGLSYILQEATLALLRHPDYCISGYSSVDVKKSEFDGENRFNNLSIEERGKFDEETLVNVNNIKKKIVTNQGSNGVCNEYIVVTIIVAARGMLQLPPIKNRAQLKEALQKLATISSSNILAAEVLWTPQEENDILTEQKMHEDYPRLHPL